MTETVHTLETEFGNIEVLEQGAHLASWRCDEKEQLFVSNNALYQPGTALRGGVPICFPQFAAFGSGQKHGFARNLPWRLSKKTTSALEFEFLSNDTTRSVWPHDFALKFSVLVQQRYIEMTLDVQNTGTKSFDFGAALHTYFRCNDVRSMALRGLQHSTCWDNGTPFQQRYADEHDAVAVNGPLDRVYFDAPDNVRLEEGQWVRDIGKKGFPDIVVWNPWSDGAKGIKDMADDEYLNMICVEAAIVDTQVTLPAGERWTGQQHVRVAE